MQVKTVLYNFYKNLLVIIHEQGYASNFIFKDCIPTVFNDIFGGPFAWRGLRAIGMWAGFFIRFIYLFLFLMLAT